MDLKRLRTFVVVADLGTVSKAALRLRISQSALSRQISDLEYEFGFKLFDRIGRRLFLTTRGEQLLGDCRGVLGQLDRSASASSYSNAVIPACSRWPHRRKQSRASCPIPAAICRTVSQRAREVDGGSWHGPGATAGTRRGPFRHQA